MTALPLLFATRIRDLAVPRTGDTRGLLTARVGSSAEFATTLTGGV